MPNKQGCVVPDDEDDNELPRWVDRHSVNCYRCGTLVDERETMPNTKEYGGNDDGGDLCPACVAGLQSQAP